MGRVGLEHDVHLGVGLHFRLHVHWRTSTASYDTAASNRGHAASSHGLDLHLLIRRLKLDLYDKMKLVNFLRKSLRAPGADVAAVVAAVVACQPGAPEPWPWSEDTNLQPVLADDPLLYSLSMDDEEPDEAEEQACTRTCTRTCACQGVG